MGAVSSCMTSAIYRYKRWTITGAFHTLSSITCTMKIILLVLAGLSLAHADCVKSNSCVDPLQCVKNAIKNAADFFPKLASFLSCHYSNEVDKFTYRESLTQLEEILECAECDVGFVLGFPKGELEKLLADPESDLTEIGNKLVALLGELKLTPGGADVLCKLMEGRVSLLDCLEKLLEVEVLNVIEEVTALICKSNDGDLTTKEVIEFLMKIDYLSETDLDGLKDLEICLGYLGTNLSSLLNIIVGILAELLDIDLDLLPCILLG